MSAAATAAGYLYASGRLRGACQKRRFDSEYQALLNAPPPVNGIRVRAETCQHCPGKYHLVTERVRR